MDWKKKTSQMNEPKKLTPQKKWCIFFGPKKCSAWQSHNSQTKPGPKALPGGLAIEKGQVTN